MLSSLLTSALLLASAALSGVAAAPLAEPRLEKRATGKVAAYFGQVKKSDNDSLATYCASSDVDIIVLAFLNIFQGTGGLPGTNFAAYGTETIEGTDLVTNPDWEAAIGTCHDNGKLVFLSLGGATGTQTVDNSSAVTLANQVWELFGEGSGLESDRPFGSAVLDGFDLDIENNHPEGWPVFISTLRSLFGSGSKTYYISAAPQCPMPDASVGDSVYLVDYLFVQFYNNFCGGSTANVVSSFDSWSADIASNSQVGGQVFVGLPGDSTAAGSGYLDPTTMAATVAQVKNASNYGGIATWDASYANANVVNGETMLAAMKAAA